MKIVKSVKQFFKTIRLGREPRSPADVFRNPPKWNNNGGMMFVDDVVGKSNGDDAVVIKILSVSTKDNHLSQMTVKVIKCGEFFSKKNMPGTRYRPEGFEIGEVLELAETGTGNWIIIRPYNKPRHIFYFDNGFPKFEYLALAS